jgi:nitrogen fixation NifU-like protein
MKKDEDLERFAKELQNQILEHARKRYSETVIDYWQNPRNMMAMETPDGYAKTKGTCGDSMEMFIKMKNDTIEECTYQTDGCGTTIACGSMATELACGKDMMEALAKVSADEILKGLGGLPEEDVHCAQLAAETLRRALADHLSHKQSPWKKHYRQQ